MSDAPAVSVIIVTFNSMPLVARTMAALAAQTMRDFEVIVLDNASAQGPPTLPDDPRFRLVQAQATLGFAGGNNVAARQARAPWLALLNPDAFPEPDWLANLLAAAKRYPDVAMAGSLQLDAADLTQLDGAGDCYHAFGIAWRGLFGKPRTGTPATGEAFGPCAAAALYRRDVFDAIGGFDEDFFCYHEDVDLAFRMRLAGWRCVQSAEAVVAHVGSATTGRTSDFAVFHGVRNRMWTFVKDMPLPLLLLLAPAHAAASLFLLFRSARSGTFGPTSRGMAAGLAGVPRMLRKRGAVQATRRGDLRALIKAFTWSIVKLRRRDHDVQPWVAGGR
jgi:GT2 family glycosyltransferase